MAVLPIGHQAHHPQRSDGVLPTGRSVRVGVWAPDPLALAGLVAAVRPARATQVVAEVPDDCDVLLVAEDEAGSGARFAAARATADREVPVLWVRHDPGSASPNSHVVIDVLDRAEVHHPGFNERLVRVARSGVPAPSPRRPLEVDWATEGAQPCQDLSTTGRSATGSFPATELSRLLSARDLDVLRLIAAGEDTPGIAARTFYSERTVKNVVHQVVQRLGVRNRAQAVAVVVRAGLV